MMLSALRVMSLRDNLLRSLLINWTVDGRTVSLCFRPSVHPPTINNIYTCAVERVCPLSGLAL